VLYDYEQSRAIDALRPTFAAIVMAAARKADSDNLALLERCWPEIVSEMRARYDAPGGVLKGERQ
jgi:hypothetical protein